LLYIQLKGALRAGPWLAAVHAKAPHDSGADCRAALRPARSWLATRGPWRAWRRLRSPEIAGHCRLWSW